MFAGVMMEFCSPALLDHAAGALRICGNSHGILVLRTRKRARSEHDQQLRQNAVAAAREEEILGMSQKQHRLPSTPSISVNDLPLHKSVRLFQLGGAFHSKMIVFNNLHCEIRTLEDTGDVVQQTIKVEF